MNGFRGKIFSIYGKNCAIKYITHLDKFSYFPKHYNFHETMLYSQYPFENFQVKISVLSYNLKYSDEMTVSQNNFNIFFERKILLENQQKLHYLQNIYMYVHPTTSYICKHYTYYKMN